MTGVPEITHVVVLRANPVGNVGELEHPPVIVAPLEGLRVGVNAVKELPKVIVVAA